MGAATVSVIRRTHIPLNKYVYGKRFYSDSHEVNPVRDL